MKLLLNLLTVTLCFTSTAAFAQTAEININGSTAFVFENRVVLMLEGAQIQSLDELHQVFSEALSLPAYYGNNFDALYDVLTDQGLISKKIEVTIINGGLLEKNLGKDILQKLLNVLNDAQQEDATHVDVLFWN